MSVVNRMFLFHVAVHQFKDCGSSGASWLLMLMLVVFVFAICFLGCQFSYRFFGGDKRDLQFIENKIFLGFSFKCKKFLNCFGVLSLSLFYCEHV